MAIIRQYLTRNPCYKAGKTIAVKGLMLHSVGCSQPNPLVFVKNWNVETHNNSCVHGFVGETDAYITLPCNENKGTAMRGWHCGKSGNNTHIGVEMCEPKEIKYTSGSKFTMTDSAKAKAYVESVTKNAVVLFAELCKFHGLNPLTDICSHAEGYKKGIASNHGDPEHLWKGVGSSWTMDKFRIAVLEEMTPNKAALKDNVAIEVEEMLSYDGFKKYMTQYLKEMEDKDVSDWAKEGFTRAKDAGITDGNRPQAFATRQEVAVMIQRMHGGDDK